MLLAIPPAWGGIKSRSNAGAVLCSSLLRGDGAQAAQTACGVSFSGELQTCTYKILYNVVWVTLLHQMIYGGPFQPRPFCDLGILVQVPSPQETQPQPSPHRPMSMVAHGPEGAPQARIFVST